MRTNTRLMLLLAVLCSCASEKTSDHAGLCLSFDDRSVNEWHAMRSLFNQYNAKVTFFVTQFDSLTAEEIAKLKQLQRDGHEVGSHGALHVVSERYIRAHSYKQYIEREVEPSLTSMSKHGFNATSFSYPYGAKYWFTDFLLLKEFKVVRGVVPMNPSRDISLIDGAYCDPGEERSVAALGIDARYAVTKEMIRDAMRRAVKRDEVLLLYGHIPKHGANKNAYEVDVALLEFILQEAATQGLKFYRMSELAGAGE